MKLSRGWLVGAIGGLVIGATILYAQSQVTSQGLIVQTVPQVLTVSAVTPQRVTQGDTIRVFGLAHDAQGNTVRARFQFQILNPATNLPDTTRARIVSSNDTSALLFVKQVLPAGQFKVVAGVITP